MYVKEEVRPGEVPERTLLCPLALDNLPAEIKFIMEEIKLKEQETMGEFESQIACIFE